MHLMFDGGCTIGAKIFEPGEWFAVYKNKDFKRKAFEDDLLVEEDIFGIRGTQTWGGSGAEVEAFSGLSLGLNGHYLFCADANIKTLARKKNYDQLVEFALRHANTAGEVAGVLSKEIKNGYGWTNIVAADSHNVIAHEVGADVKTEPSKSHVTRTNHFLKTPNWKVDYHQNAGTWTRFRDSTEKLGRVDGLDDIFELLKTHRSRKLGNSICNHGTIHTVYSYVYEWKHGKSTFYVCQGNPCENEYVRLDLSFPITAEKARHILERYPSKRTRERASRMAPLLRTRP